MKTDLPSPLIEGLSKVRTVGAITGAGVSAESGIQTYRGQGGLYDDPEEGDRTVESLSGSTLRADPGRTWRAVAGLARMAQDAVPNPAHRALANLEDRLDHFVLLTQNVDGLHKMAGSRNIIDIHGDVFATRCMSCGDEGRLDRETLQQLNDAPSCDRCYGVLRPDAVLFGESLPHEKLTRIYEEFHAHPPDLILVIGTSAMFPYISSPIHSARRQGRITVEVNPEPTVLTDKVDYSLRGPAGLILPALVDRINQKQ